MKTSGCALRHTTWTGAVIWATWSYWPSYKRWTCTSNLKGIGIHHGRLTILSNRSGLDLMWIWTTKLAMRNLSRFSIQF